MCSVRVWICEKKLPGIFSMDRPSQSFTCDRAISTAMPLVKPMTMLTGTKRTRLPSLKRQILFLVLGCLFLFILKFFHNTERSLVGISLTLFGILYISWFLSFLIKIRFLPDGAVWAAYLLSVTKAADVGAYLVGL